MKIYAYVTNENCTITRACRPGSAIDGSGYPSRDGFGEAVSRHGDWGPWTHGKRETLRLAEHGKNSYERACAWEVLEILDWEPTCTNEDCTLEKNHLGKCEVEK